MPIRIDANDLIDALTSGPREYGGPGWLLDPRTGAIGLSVEDDDGFDPELADAEHDVPRDVRAGGSWIEIDAIESSEAYRIMERFAFAQEDDEVRDVLERALAGKGAFRRFRDAVARWPDVLAAWREFHDREVLVLGRQWLEREGIEATIVSPQPAAAAPPVVEPPKQAKAPRIGLLELLLLGAPDGKTERLGGKVPRVFVGRDPGAARRVFADVARDIHELEGLGWRKRYIEGRDEVTVGRYTLRIDRRIVELDVAIEPGIWARFHES